MSEAQTQRMARMTQLLYMPYTTVSTRDLPPKEGFSSLEWDSAIRGYERAAMGGRSNPQQVMPRPYAEFFQALRRHYVEQADAFVDLT
jgi:hypothetical protein